MMSTWLLVLIIVAPFLLTGAFLAVLAPLAGGDKDA